jgi:kynurenine formamidase
VSNWNRWGAEDELGAANLLTPGHVLDALRTAAVSGRVYPLAQPLQMAGAPKSDSGLAVHMLAQDAGDYATGNAEPVGDGQSVAFDYLFLRIHGSATHIDSLGHVWAGEQLYNGHPSAGTGSRGLLRCGIDKLPGIVTRGVLLDLAGAAGKAHLEPSHEVTPGEIEACAKSQGIEIRERDAVLLRTGWPQVYQRDPDLYVWEFPGIGLDAARWLAECDVVLVGADTLGVEARTRAKPWDLPVHLCLLHEHGIYLLELLDLERLATDRVFSFLFLAAPLRLTGGTGAPISPLAIA